MDAHADTAHSNGAGGPAATVGVGTGVEQDDGAALGRPVLLANHEVAGARRGGPVDPAQVVAVAVLADGHVVLAVQGDEVGELFGPHAGARLPAGGQRVDLGQDDEVRRPLQDRVARGEAERILDLHGKRPEVMAPAQVRPDGVVDDPDPPGGMRPTMNRGRSPRT